MNTIFVKARNISKSLKGNRGSAVNYAKYILRKMKGVDYTDKGEIIASGIEGTEESPIDFWTKAEARENQTKRKDTARFAKEYIMALPHEIPKEEMQKICESVAKILAKDNRVVQWAMHEPDKTEGSSENNFHCHFLMSEREYKNGVFADTKNREWNKKSFLQKHKKEIGAEINKSLERYNLPRWSVEIGEDVEPKIDRTESQIRAERANQKALKKAERKLKLAEVKLNGLGRAERQLSSKSGTVEAEPGREQQSNSAGAASIEKQYADFQKLERAYTDFQQTERLREAEQRKLEEERRRAEQERKERLQRIEQQRKLEAERAERERQENARRNSKSNNRDSGWSR